MQIADSHVLNPLPPYTETFWLESARSLGAFLRVGRPALEQGEVGPLVPAHCMRWVALYRGGPYWCRPAFGREPEDVPPDTQYLLWQRDGGYGIILPLVDGDLRASLRGTEEGLALDMGGALPGQEPEHAKLAFVAAGPDPYELTRAAVEAVAKHTRTFRPRREKPLPEFMNYLGWCTWDAFYHEVDHEKVIAGLRSFREGGVQPGFMILDDGWLDRSGDMLNSFEANADKFPEGLSGLVKEARDDYGLRVFGCWHAFEGYWAGLNPHGALADDYRLVDNEAVIRPWAGDDVVQLHLVHPGDIHRFYADFYRKLHAAGVDMVKVDGQSALELFTEGKLGRVSTMRAYQEAMQGAAQVQFQGNLIHCMSNGSDVAYSMQSTLCWRNSQDYFPDRPLEVAQRHVHMNAINNMWSSTFALPDWDMFQTHQPDAAFHAAARAISGGPVYVCDEPGEQDFALLEKLCISGGRVLRCDRPALPAEDSLFVDCTAEPRLLKLTNRAREAGVLGLFNCRIGDDPVKDGWRPSDLPDLDGEAFAAWLHNAEEMVLVSRQEMSTLELAPGEFELVTLAPVRGSMAALGLLDKYAGAAAVVEQHKRGTTRESWKLADGGRMGFYCESRPTLVYVDGRETPPLYDPDTGLLTVSTPPGHPVKVEIGL